MLENEVVRRAFAMPLTNPAYPPGPYRFVNRGNTDHHLSHRSGEAAIGCSGSARI